MRLFKNTLNNLVSLAKTPKSSKKISQTFNSTNGKKIAGAATSAFLVVAFTNLPAANSWNADHSSQTAEIPASNTADSLIQALEMSNNMKPVADPELTIVDSGKSTKNYRSTSKNNITTSHTQVGSPSSTAALNTHQITHTINTGSGNGESSVELKFDVGSEARVVVDGDSSNISVSIKEETRN